MPFDPPADDPNLEEILLNALASLQEKNAAAYILLKAQIDLGFFAVRMTKRPLQNLADELLGTVFAAEDRVDAD